MALSAAACAEKYSINDCGTNIAIAAQKYNDAFIAFNRTGQQLRPIIYVTYADGRSLWRESV
jgi:mRNA-degrading endonuclease HigB of HigAB toxin-antitoxin module